jgi:hypothetical protein
VDAVVVVAEELPQAHSARTMHRAITKAIIFFIDISSNLKLKLNIFYNVSCL